MRDYEINEAQSRLAYGRFTWLARLAGNWQMRKDLKKLRVFSDYQLRDIGLSRHELNQLVRLPLDRDTIWETERRALMNSKYESPGNSSLVLSKIGIANLASLAYPAGKGVTSFNSGQHKV